MNKRKMINDLWDVLDDIDTADDIVSELIRGLLNVNVEMHNAEYNVKEAEERVETMKREVKRRKQEVDSRIEVFIQFTATLSLQHLDDLETMVKSRVYTGALRDPDERFQEEQDMLLDAIQAAIFTKKGRKGEE